MYIKRTQVKQLRSDATAAAQQEPPRWQDTPDAAQGPLFLHIWLSDGLESLVVGQKARLSINIACKPGQPGRSQEHRGELSDYLDVLVSCEGCVLPERWGRLHLPAPTNTLQLTLTPERAGPVEVKALLLDRNEPVYQTNYSFDVKERP